MQRNASRDLTTWNNKKKRKPLIVLGARQVGKTYLLKEFGKEHFPVIHTLNFETDTRLADIFAKDLEPKRLVRDLSLLIDKPINPKTDLVFFDEIQNAPRALTSLKHFHEQMPELAICCAGSLLGLHLNEGSFPVGYVDFLYLFPLSFDEFIEARASKTIAAAYYNVRFAKLETSEVLHQKLWELWREYLIVGGLPEVVVNYIKNDPGSVSSFKNARDLQQKLITSYLADVAKHSGKVNSMHIERVWNAIPTQLAAVHDQSSKRFAFKDIVPGIHNYARLSGAIDWLQKAGLIHRVPICDHAETPVSAYVKENRFKLYMFDVGILGAMLELPPAALMAYDFGTYKGYFAENFVAQELKSSRPSTSLFSWTGNQAEMEFLIQGSTGPIPIEVKSALRVRSQSLKAFVEKYKPQVSVVVSGRQFSNVPEKGTSITKINIPLYLTPRIWDMVDLGL